MPVNQRIAIFPGTFDPFTNGHHDIVMKATKLFDKVIIAFGVNSQKQRIFPLEVIVNKLKAFYANNPKIEIVEYNEITVDFAEKMNAICIVRGLRNGTDFNYEKPIALINSKLNSQIETLFLIANSENESISSTILRDLYKYKKDISGYVPYDLK